MNAQLKVYADCTIEEPTKVYTCRRLLFGVAKKVADLANGVEQKPIEEQERIYIAICKTIFPHFDEADFDGIDRNEWVRFIEEIGKSTDEVMDNAQKN